MNRLPFPFVKSLRSLPNFGFRVKTPSDEDLQRAGLPGPHTLNGKSFILGQRLKGGGLPAAACATEQRSVRPERGAIGPNSRGVGHIDGVSNPCTQGASEFLLYYVRLLKSPTHSPSADPDPTKRTHLEREVVRLISPRDICRGQVKMTHGSLSEVVHGSA